MWNDKLLADSDVFIDLDSTLNSDMTSDLPYITKNEEMQAAKNE